jgi:hypothetical protein
MRKLAAMRLANVGCSCEMIKVITGHRSDSALTLWSDSFPPRGVACQLEGNDYWPFRLRLTKKTFRAQKVVSP